MKKKLLVLLVWFVISDCFAIEKAIVNSDRVNVRSSTNTISDSNILYQLNSGDEILIYGSYGDKSFKNGIYNYWYNISYDKREYINAMYVTTFPFENMSYEISNFEKIIKYQFVMNYKKENDKLLFYGKRVIDSLYIDDSWFDSKSINWIDNKSHNIQIFLDTLIEILNKNEDILITEKILNKEMTFNSTKVFYKDFYGCPLLANLEIIDKSVILPFNIYVGIDIDDIINLFGNNFNKSGNSIVYRFGYGEISQIIFYLSENFVTKIQVKQSI